MHARGADLLRQLGAGVRPDGAAPSSAPAGAGIGSASFSDLLGRARAGELSSGRPVSVGSGVEVELDAGQLERLGRAADGAEAAGASRLLAMIDGQLVTVDVGSRTVTGGAPEAGGVTTEIDAFVIAPAAQGDAGSLFGVEDGSPGGAWGLPGLGALRNASLSALLGGRAADA